MIKNKITLRLVNSKFFKTNSSLFLYSRLIVSMKKLDMSFKKTTLGVCVLAATLSSMTFADNTVQGNGAKVDGSDKAVALGDSVLIESDSNQAVAIGSNAVIQKNSSLAIAIGAHSNADQAGAVALGAGSDTKTNATAASDITVKDGNGNDITISASNFAGNENISAGDQVSVGSIKNERQIKNVAAGTINKTSTDAVNGSQLYEVVDNLAKGIKTTQTEVIEGKNVTVTSTTGANGQTVYNVATKDDVDFEKVTVGKVVVDKDKGIDAGDTKITNVTAGEVSATSKDAINGSQLYKEASKAKTEVTEGKNVTVTSTMGANGQTVYNVATKDDVDFEKVTVGKVVVDKDKGIDAGDTKITNVTAGEVSATSKDAINGSQLYKEASKAKTEVTEGKNVTVTSTTGANGQTVYNVATKDDVDFEKVTVGKVVVDKDKGIDAGNTQITHVTAGTKVTDAVNLGQLQSTVSIFGGGSTINSDGSIKNPTYNVNGGTYNNVGDALGALNQVDIDLGNRITNLQQTFNKRIDDVEDKLSAGVASALALESAPYVAGKYTYAAGSGFYNGQSALGVSLRKTADNGRWSLTGGVAAASQGEASFRIGINGVID